MMPRSSSTGRDWLIRAVRCPTSQAPMQDLHVKLLHVLISTIA